MRPRRGVALLVVLGTLAIGVTAVAGLARAAAAARLSRASAASIAGADNLLLGAEEAILDWLQRHAGRIVLGPDALTPRFDVLDDRFGLQEAECRLAIWAYDQCGMPSPDAFGVVPADLLPSDVREALERLTTFAPEDRGLDLIAADPQLARHVFPGEPANPGAMALGAVVATHNPATRRAVPTINVNTAPLPLIAAAYRARGLGGLEELADARAAGRVSSPGAAAPHSTIKAGGAPLAVGMSTCWAFRIDCQIGRVRRSWWEVYADTGSNWERVQRLAIRE